MNSLSLYLVIHMKKVILVAGSLDPIKSYEYHNFQRPLEKLGHAVLPFDFLEVMHAHGRDEMNRKLLATVKEYLPDIVIFVPITDQFIPEIVDEIGQLTITLGYFFDDMWRIGYSRFWARHFNFVTTSDVNGLRKFRDAGFTNVIYLPFACNTDVYYNRNLTKIYDVSFVGQYHPYREWYLNYLKKEGIDVQIWGTGWPSNMVSSEDMINIFNQSRINLNLSNCVCWDIRYLLTPFRSLVNTLRVWEHAFLATYRLDMKTVEQVKGRHFEINACGGFQLSYYVEGLERCYQIGEEIQLYASPDDLIDKIRYYLKHGDEREIIAQRGWKRTLAEHTMEQRFQQIFEQVISK